MCVVQIETILTVFYKHRLCGVFIVCEPRQRCGDIGSCSSDHLSDFTHRSSVRLQQRVNLHTGIIPTDIDQQEGITPQTRRIKRIRKLAATRSDREKATVDGGGGDGRCNFIPWAECFSLIFIIMGLLVSVAPCQHRQSEVKTDWSWDSNTNLCSRWRLRDLLSGTFSAVSPWLPRRRTKTNHVASFFLKMWSFFVFYLSSSS